MRPPVDTVIQWVRSVGPGGEDLVPMFYKGPCRRADEGEVGYDVRVRPVSLGRGPYTATVGGDAVRWPDPK